MSLEHSITTQMLCHYHHTIWALSLFFRAVMTLLLYPFSFPTTVTTSSSWSYSMPCKPGVVCSRPSRPCVCTYPSRFRPLGEHCASWQESDPRHRACDISLCEPSGSRARPRCSPRTATPAREGGKSSGQSWSHSQ